MRSQDSHYHERWIQEVLRPTVPPSSNSPSCDLRMLIKEEIQFVRDTFSFELRNLNTTISNLSNVMKAINEKIDYCTSQSRETILQVDALEDKVDEIIKGNFFTNSCSDSCLHKFVDRVRRRKNLIVYGLKDGDPSHPLNSRQNYLTVTKSLLTLCKSEFLFDNIKI